MRSGLWPSVGLASGVICPALKYCSTGVGSCSCCYVRNYLHKQVAVSRQGAEVIPMFRTHAKWSLFTIFRSMVWTCSVTSDKNRAHTGACTGAGGSGSAQKSLDLLNNLFCDWELAVHFWQLPGLVFFHQHALMQRHCEHVTASACLSVLRVMCCTGAASHSARTMAQRANQSSAQKRSNRASRK